MGTPSPLSPVSERPVAALALLLLQKLFLGAPALPSQGWAWPAQVTWKPGPALQKPDVSGKYWARDRRGPLRTSLGLFQSVPHHSHFRFSLGVALVQLSPRPTRPGTCVLLGFDVVPSGGARQAQGKGARGTGPHWKS